jgi:hypothetical protein
MSPSGQNQEILAQTCRGAEKILIGGPGEEFYKRQLVHEVTNRVCVEKRALEVSAQIPDYLNVEQDAASDAARLRAQMIMRLELQPGVVSLGHVKRGKRAKQPRAMF